MKKRRLVNGKELVFRNPAEESDEDGHEDEDEDGPEAGAREEPTPVDNDEPVETPRIATEQRITIYEDE